MNQTTAHKKPSSSQVRPAALVTGAAKRIGLASAEAAAACGFDIALHYNHSADQAAQAAAELEQHYSVRCVTFQANLADAAAVTQLANDVAEQLPRLSLLINSASVFTPSDMLDESDDFIAQTLQINLLAPWQLSRLCAKHWRRRVAAGCAQIINYTDQRVNRVAQGHFAYNISKHGLNALTEAAALQLAPHTRVNAIAPGLILPPPELTDEAEIKAFIQRRASSVPLLRSGSLAEIGAAVSSLINNRFITGQTIYVDGGEHLL